MILEKTVDGVLKSDYSIDDAANKDNFDAKIAAWDQRLAGEDVIKNTWVKTKRVDYYIFWSKVIQISVIIYP